jgi:hypothetical protein
MSKEILYPQIQGVTGTNRPKRWILKARGW